MQQPGEGLCSCPWGGAELRLGGCHQLPAEALGETHPILRKAGVPLDNNIVERALKKAILHRKNSLFYKTRKGAQMGDLFMSVPLYECDPHLRTQRRQCVRLSHGVASARRGAEAKSVGVDAVELPRYAGTARQRPPPRNKMNLAWPKRIDGGQAERASWNA